MEGVLDHLFWWGGVLDLYCLDGFVEIFSYFDCFSFVSWVLFCTDYLCFSFLFFLSPYLLFLLWDWSGSGSRFWFGGFSFLFQLFNFLHLLLFLPLFFRLELNPFSSELLLLLLNSPNQINPQLIEILLVLPLLLQISRIRLLRYSTPLIPLFRLQLIVLLYQSLNIVCFSELLTVCQMRRQLLLLLSITFRYFFKIIQVIKKILVFFSVLFSSILLFKIGQPSLFQLR